VSAHFETRSPVYRKSLFRGWLYFLFFAMLFFGFAYWTTHLEGEEAWGSGEKIALLRLEGVIFDSREIIKELQKYGSDPEIKAILLRIDSPGGAVAPSQEIYDAVIKIQEAGEKKLVTSMGTVAASGGYYIASATDLIIANPGTLTGSIGVIMQLTNVEGLFEKVGLESVTIKSGRNKDVGSPFRKMQPKERALLQSVLDDVHEQFIEAVSKGRSLDLEAVRALSDGRVFTGRQAKDVGLVDELGGLERAIERTAELAGIEGRPEVIEKKEKLPLLELLQGRLFNKWKASTFPGSSLRMDYLFSY